MISPQSLELSLSITFCSYLHRATEELVQAVAAIREAVASGQLRPSDVSPQLLDSCLHTPPGCPAVDLVIRTSGETRLSDFMLWQVGIHAVAGEACVVQILKEFAFFKWTFASSLRHGGHSWSS